MKGQSSRDDVVETGNRAHVAGLRVCSLDDAYNMRRAGATCFRCMMALGGSKLSKGSHGIAVGRSGLRLDSLANRED